MPTVSTARSPRGPVTRVAPCEHGDEQPNRSCIRVFRWDRRSAMTRMRSPRSGTSRRRVQCNYVGPLTLRGERGVELTGPLSVTELGLHAATTGDRREKNSGVSIMSKRKPNP